MKRPVVLALGLALFAVHAHAAAVDSLTLTAAPNPAPAGTEVTFTFAPKITATGDHLNFTFGDGGTGTVEYSVACAIFGGCSTIHHTYAGAGTLTVTAAGTIGGHSVSGSAKVNINGSAEDGQIYIATAANLPGFNGTHWHTDLFLNNPGTITAQYVLAALARNQDNSSPQTVTLSLNAGQGAALRNALQNQFGFSGAAALRITVNSGTLLVSSRTFNQLDKGTFGQSVPAITRAGALAFGQVGRLIGLSHDPSLATGYRTNIGLVNASPAGIHVVLDFRLNDGSLLGIAAYDLLPYEFRQIDRAFETVTGQEVSDGFVEVQTTTAGARFFAYASVIDNMTGDPTFVSTLFPD